MDLNVLVDKTLTCAGDGSVCTEAMNREVAGGLGWKIVFFTRSFAAHKIVKRYKKPRPGWNFDSVDIPQKMTHLSWIGGWKVLAENVFNFIL